MIGTVLETDDLLRMTGYTRPSDAARCLRQQGVHVFEGRHGIWTTLEALNAAAGVRPARVALPRSGHTAAWLYLPSRGYRSTYICAMGWPEAASLTM